MSRLSLRAGRITGPPIDLGFCEQACAMSLECQQVCGYPAAWAGLALLPGRH